MTTIEILRQYRIFGYAIFDLATAFLGIWLLSPLLRWLFRHLKLEIPIWVWLVWTLPISILAHLAVGRRTLMVENFLDPSGHYWLKGLIIVLATLGFVGIKKIDS